MILGPQGYYQARLWSCVPLQLSWKRMGRTAVVQSTSRGLLMHTFQNTWWPWCSKVAWKLGTCSDQRGSEQNYVSWQKYSWPSQSILANAGTVPECVTTDSKQELATEMQKRVQVLGNKTFVKSRVVLAAGKCELAYELSYWMSKTSITRSKMCWRQNIWGWQEQFTIIFKVKLTADRIHWVHNILYFCLLKISQFTCFVDLERVPRRISGPKREVVQQLHSDERHSSYSWQNIIKVIKSRWRRGARNITRTGKTRNTYTILAEEPEDKETSWGPICRREFHNYFKVIKCENVDLIHQS